MFHFVAKKKGLDISSSCLETSLFCKNKKKYFKLLSATNNPAD